MDIVFHLTWNYLLYPLAAIGVLAIIVTIWLCKQSW
jgi:hypothetical protein